jgi:hypothetical protein
MGTTTTTNLALIKPDINESIKEALPTFPGWAAQNTANCDKIDALFRKTQHTWTPSWTSDGTPPTLGTGGSVDGKYVRLFPRMVVGFFRINCGTTGFSAGTGLYRLSLPVAVPTEFTTFYNAIPIGKAYLHDNDAVATSSNMVVMYSVADNVIYFRRADGDYWRATAPITLSQSDKVSGYVLYPTSAA